MHRRLTKNACLIMGGWNIAEAAVRWDGAPLLVGFLLFVIAGLNRDLIIAEKQAKEAGRD